jgi:hypothetical protein
MKVCVSSLDAAEVRRKFPIADRVLSWFFSCNEQSNNVYKGEGTDLWGRRVSSVGTNYERVLKECADQAETINAQLASWKA